MAERKWFKGTAALELDRWYSSGDVGDNLIEARGLLRQPDSFHEIVEQLYTADHWNPEEQYSYPRHDPLQGPEFEAVARRGFLEAIALARRHSPAVPIRTYWMNGVGNETFEMHVADDADQVAVTLLIPNDEGGSDDHGPESWVVSIDGESDVKVEQTSGPRDRQPPSETDPD
jgi:hypothetical protein